jgi:hypothetical protein
MVKEIVLPNKFNNLCRLLKKDLRTLCKFEIINKVNYFILGNGLVLSCWPYLIEDNTQEGPYDFEYVKLNKYHAKFLLQPNPSGFNFQVSEFFDKTIIKNMEFDLGYRKEIFIYNFIQTFDNFFDLRLVDVIYEIYEKKVICYQLDNEIYMLDEYRNRDKSIEPFKTCSIKLFFKGLK